MRLFVKKLIFLGVFPAVVFWPTILFKIGWLPILQAMVLLYGLIYVPFSIVRLVPFAHSSGSKMTRFIIWWPFLLYCFAATYFGLFMSASIYHKRVAFLDQFMMSGLALIFIFIGMLIVWFASRPIENKTEGGLDA